MNPSRLYLYRVQPQFSGRDDEGWSHSLPGPTMVIAASDEGAAVRTVCNLAWGMVTARWPERHCYTLVHRVTDAEAPYGRLDASHPGGIWVRVSYWYGGIETVHGGTYADVKHTEGR